LPDLPVRDYRDIGTSRRYFGKMEPAMFISQEILTITVGIHRTGTLVERLLFGIRVPKSAHLRGVPSNFRLARPFRERDSG
jgi:hypothetical protein